MKFAVVCFAVFFIASLVVQQVRINDKEEKLEELKAQLSTQQVKNEEIQQSLDNSGGLEDFAEKKARSELDYAKPGERIFVDAGGSN